MGQPVAPAQVAVVDDHSLIGRLVVGLLERAGYTAAHTFGSTIEATLELLETVGPQMILLDFDLGPLQSAGQILDWAADRDVTVAGLTASDDRIEHAAFLERGGAAVIPKSGGPTDLVAVVELGLGGNELMSPDERHQALSRLRKHRARRASEVAVFERLTARECETLVMLTEGCGAAEIAAEWEVAMPTVRTHIRSVLAKLGVSSQLQAAALARDSGWYDLVGRDPVSLPTSSILTMPAAPELGTIAGRSGSKG